MISTSWVVWHALHCLPLTLYVPPTSSQEKLPQKSQPSVHYSSIRPLARNRNFENRWHFRVLLHSTLAYSHKPEATRGCTLSARCDISMQWSFSYWLWKVTVKTPLKISLYSHKIIENIEAPNSPTVSEDLVALGRFFAWYRIFLQGHDGIYFIAGAFCGRGKEGKSFARKSCGEHGLQGKMDVATLVI